MAPPLDRRNMISQPTNIHQVHMSPLLRLPGEIRNAIYTFAFQEPDKIIPEGKDDTNRLKMVCRQIYREAAWLELSCNDPITLVRQTYQQAEPSKQFLSFSNNFPPEAFDHIRTVILTCANDPILVDVRIRDALVNPPTIAFTQILRDVAKSWGPPRSLLRLADICRSHPNITVRYILPSFLLEDDQPEDTLYWLLEGISWTYAIRREKPGEAFMYMGAARGIFEYLWCRAMIHLQAMAGMSAAQVNQIPVVDDYTSPKPVRPRFPVPPYMIAGLRQARMKSRLAELRKFEPLRVANLKFLPKCANFDEAGFRKKLYQCRYSSNQHASMVVNNFLENDTFDKWVATARRWVEDGI